jgi:hypothetical protein
MTQVSQISLSSWNVNSRLSILTGGTAYYIVVLIFAISHFESKFIMDGFSHVFTIANSETFSQAMGRHVLILHQLLPVICAKLGATTLGIMEAYVVGDVLFHFSIFLVLLFFFKDQLAALFAVSVHVFGMYYNHFMMVGELHPGSMFAIMTLSIILSWNGLNKWKKILVIPAAFFTVSSHPLALVGFLVSAWLWRIATEKSVGLSRLWLIALSLFMLLLKLLLLDDYDQQTIESNLRTFSEAALVLIDSSYLLNFTLFFLFTSPIVAITGLFGSLYLIDKRKYVTVLLFFLFQMGWVVLVQQYIDFTYFALDSIQTMIHDRYLFPMRFVALSMVFLIVIPLRTQGSGWPTVHRYVIASWMLGLPFLFFSAKKADKTIAAFRDVVHIAREQKITKGYYSVEEYCDDVYIHRGSFFTTFILSSIDGGEPSHIIHASAETIRDLNSVKPEELLLMRGITCSKKQLNPKRFRVDSGPYKQLDYSCNSNH